ADAISRSEIDAEAGLLYRVFATFGDGRLPDRYRGDDSLVTDDDALSEALARWSTLPPSTQATLGPFLTMPIYDESWTSTQALSRTSGSGLRTDVTAPNCHIGSW